MRTRLVSIVCMALVTGAGACGGRAGDGQLDNSATANVTGASTFDATVTFETAAIYYPTDIDYPDADDYLAAQDCYNATASLVGGITFYFGGGNAALRQVSPAADLDEDGLVSSQAGEPVEGLLPGDYFIYVPGYDVRLRGKSAREDAKVEIPELNAVGTIVSVVASQAPFANDFEAVLLNGESCPQ